MVMDTNEYQTLLYRGGMVILSLATVAVIAALAHPAALLGRILGAPPLRWIGVRSYGIYLWHYPIIVLTTPVDSTPGPLLALLQVGATVAVAGALLALRGGAHPEARVPRGLRRAGRPPVVVPGDPHRALGRARRSRAGARRSRGWASPA